MSLVVVPFHDGKSRLAAPRHARRRLALAMLGDVLAACAPVGEVVLVTDDPAARELADRVVHDPGRGQGAAVAAALAGREPGPVLVVNADVPAVVPDDLRALLAATPIGGLALVEADDGTTNALSLPAPHVFEPFYGPGSAARFRDHARALGLEAISVAIPSLADDVDTLDDLRRVGLRAGPRTQAALTALAA
jgi:2-phospho-L-lactate guanylyltransferase